MLETDDGLRLQGFNLSDVVGRKITCEDGVKRHVEQISYSHRYCDKVLINEINEDETPGGAWVHCLSLSCQMLGKPLPTQEQKIAFSKMCMAMRWHQEEHEGRSVTTPSGLIIPK